jgi:hypothetical protein
MTYLKSMLIAFCKTAQNSMLAPGWIRVREQPLHIFLGDAFSDHQQLFRAPLQADNLKWVQTQSMVDN